MEEFVLGPAGEGAAAPVSSNKKCPACGEFSVERDDDGCQLVCVSCGRILEESCLVNQAGLTEGTTTVSSENSNFTSTLPMKYLLENNHGGSFKSRGFHAGIRRMKNVSQSLSMSSAMTTEAKTLFESTYMHENIIHLSSYNKETIGACCAYIVARRLGWPVSKTDISRHCQRPIKDVVHYYKILQHMHGIEDAQPDLEEMVETTLVHCAFEQNVLNSTLEIIKLAREVWLEAGRRPLNVLTSAAYIAYQAHTGALPLVKFCSKFKMKHSKSMAKCVSDIIVVFMRFGEELPWLNITKKKIHLHVLEILSYKKAILHGITKEHEQLLAEEKETESDTNDQVEVIPGTSAGPEATDDSDPTALSIGHNSYGNGDNRLKKRPNEEEDDIEGTRAKLQKMEKDIVIYPRSFITNREKSPDRVVTPPEDLMLTYKGDINSTELTSHDIADGDLHEYIKTSEEMKLTVFMNEKGML